MNFIKPIIIALAMFFSALVAFGQNATVFDKQYLYYHGDLSKKDYTYYKFYIPADEIGVFTLKSKYTNSDLDLYLYDSYSNELDKSAGTGTQNEIVNLTPSGYGRYVLIKVKNYEDYTSSYKIYAHSVNPYDKMLEAGLMGLFKLLFSDFSSTSNQQDNIDRGVNIANSIIRGYDLSTSTRSLLLNELSIGLRNELGYGALAGFVIDSIILIYDDIYKHYW